MPEFYIGLMSGTSLDGVDGVLADLQQSAPRLLAHSHQSFMPALQAEIAALNLTGTDELRRAALTANELARAYAGVVQALLVQTGGNVSVVKAIGCHGQTVRHQ